MTGVRDIKGSVSTLHGRIDRFVENQRQADEVRPESEIRPARAVVLLPVTADADFLPVSRNTE
jgi:hypothetical protein